MTSVLTRMVARALLAPTLIVAAAVLVKGYADVGDGFAAGIIASLALLLQYLAFGHAEVERALPVRHAPLVGLAGLLLAVAILVVPMLAGDAPLEHWPPPGREPTHVGSLEIITAVAFDIGVFLLVVGAAATIIATLAAAESEMAEEDEA